MAHMREEIIIIATLLCFGAVLFFLVQDATAARTGGKQTPTSTTNPTNPTGPSQVSPPTKQPPTGGFSGQRQIYRVLPQGVIPPSCVGDCARQRDLCLTHCSGSPIQGCSQRCYNYYNGCASRCALKVR